MDEIMRRASQSAMFDILPEERQKLEKQLQETLEYIQVLHELTPDGATVWADGFVQPLREDEAAPSIDRQAILKNAAAAENGLFTALEKRV